MNLEEKFMRAAIAEAAKAPWPFGAVIVKDGEIIAQVGAGDGEDNLIDPTAHAEINAVRFACKKLQTPKLDGAILYASCEPCALCMGAAWYAGIRSIVFGSPISEEEPMFGWKDFAIPLAVLSDMSEGTLIVEGGLLQEEVVAMYKNHPLYRA